MRVAVIGAGPSGLVTLKYLLAAQTTLNYGPIDVRLFESEPSVGGTFLARTYEKAELVSSKQLTTFSDFRVIDKTDFLSAPRYVEYLHEYTTHYKLWPHIHLLSTITKLTRQNDGVYNIVYKHDGRSHTWNCDAVAVCSGLHVVPNIPSIEGIENVKKKFHSAQFKSSEQFGVDTTVLVLGSGETGADVCHLAITAPTAKVVLCHNDGFHLAPKTNPSPKTIFHRNISPTPQVPIDVSRASIFDTAYVHPWLRNSNILWTYYDYYIRWILWTSWGTTHGQDQWVGGKPEPWSTSEIFFNKSGHKIAPYLRYWKEEYQQTLLGYIRSLIMKDPPRLDTKGRHLDVAPWPARFDENGIVQFRNNKRPEYGRMRDQKIKPDVVVYCTGYKQEFSFLGNLTAETDVREIWNRETPSLGFIGFVRPNLGAIPSLAEMQAQLWVLNLLAPEHVSYPLAPEDEPHYRLVSKRTARIQYGVDHESYAYQLALDMGSAPSLVDVLRLGYMDTSDPWWKLPTTWALSANVNPKFRLIGPWKWNGAIEIMNNEIWDTIRRREAFFGHFTLTVVPALLFGPFSMAIWLLAAFSDWSASLVKFLEYAMRQVT